MFGLQHQSLCLRYTAYHNQFGSSTASASVFPESCIFSFLADGSSTCAASTAAGRAESLSALFAGAPATLPSGCDCGVSGTAGGCKTSLIPDSR